MERGGGGEKPPLKMKRAGGKKMKNGEAPLIKENILLLHEKTALYIRKIIYQAITTSSSVWNDFGYNSFILLAKAQY